MNKYLRLQAELAEFSHGRLKGFGPSMLPVLSSGSTMTYVKSPEYRVQDIVFCRVKGRFVDAHWITAVRLDGARKLYLISNNHGHDNGWTDRVFGRVVHEDRSGVTGYTSHDWETISTRFA